MRLKRLNDMNWMFFCSARLVLAALFLGMGIGMAKTKDSSTDPTLTGELNQPVNATTPPSETTVSTNSLLGITPAIQPFHPTPAATPPADETRVATLTTDDLKEYESQPEGVRRLIARGLMLTHLKLAYKYGSADPREGGMDCSGTVYYLLGQSGLAEVPRDSGGLYHWVWTQGRFESVVSSNAKTFELERLKPGDLLFWTGTYRVDRDPPISHVMIYLGTNRHNGHRVMVGASEGRTFEGKPRFGVSVFDFNLPAAGPEAGSARAASGGSEYQGRFIGYGSIPGLEQAVPPDAVHAEPASISPKGKL